MSVRVRFAPSPTGYLHIGGARTALFCWLWARRQGGTFVLRIEDTDAERSTEESIAVIIDSMKWLGLHWDEGPGLGGPHGPYRQTERLAIYKEHADRLVESGHAYRCYATKAEIDEARAKHEAAGGKGFRFQSPWRDKKAELDKPHVYRFKAPSEGTTGWDDVVRERIEVPNDAQQDFILLRQDGVPLYNFGAVVDDITMEITLVSRGDDHIVNTPPQILLYEALGAKLPRFAHLPMILAPNGEKLSKRHAAVSVLDYRDQGYLPDGVINYLARLGWSHGDQEIFSREELIQLFDWEHVGKTAGKYDAKKFAHVQGEHLHKTAPETIATLTTPFLAKLGIELAPNDPKLALAIRFVRERATTLAEVASMVEYFFVAEPKMDEKATKKFLVPESAERLSALREVVAAVEPFESKALENVVGAWLAEKSLSMKDVAQPARVAMTGRTQSPGLFEVMEVLGKPRTLERLDKGIATARGEGRSIEGQAGG